MRTIRIKAGRSVWLIVIDGREVTTNVPISRPMTQAARAAAKIFPGRSYRCANSFQKDQIFEEQP